MDQPYKFLDEKNALAILPIPESCLQEMEAMLEAIDRGERGGCEGCIARLIQINKSNRFSTKSWGRLAGGKKVDLCITYKFITFDEQDDYSEYFFSYNAWKHGTPQAPMLMLSFDRNSGSPPVGTLENDPGTYVISRRVVSVPLQCVLKHWGDRRAHV